MNDYMNTQIGKVEATITDQIRDFAYVKRTNSGECETYFKDNAMILKRIMNMETVITFWITHSRFRS